MHDTKPTEDLMRRNRISYLASKFPVSYEAACKIFGAEPEHTDTALAAFLGVWAMLNYDFAEAMIAEEESRYDRHHL